MRKTLTTAALLLALSCPAFAGIMHTPGAPETPTAEADGIIHTGQPAQEPTANGDMQNGVTDTLTQFALSVLVSVLS